ncbi:MAG: hypothetical protein H0T51_08030 [Pirellulales bacterium]|nr:hypothetical protein [Pirellulales bacterium]
MPTYPVEGRVTFADGQPLPGGTVEFQPVAQRDESEAEKGSPPDVASSRGVIQEDGTYKISTFKPEDGATEGKHRVLVIPGLPPGPINPMSPAKPVIHHRFQRFETSGLEFTVKPDGPNKFDIAVDRP